MSSVVLTDPPSCQGWDFGDYAYALEPLTLPTPGAPGVDEEQPAGADRYQASARYLRRIGNDLVSLDGIEPCEAADELYWFRWITGHQACFAIWHLMAQIQDELADGRMPLESGCARLATYVRGYSIMLLYAGSCPRGLYHALIRPSMRLRHRSFSGGWAPDYAPVRDLFRGREVTDLPAGDGLRRSMELHRLVHDGVAAKLVPDGKSLLRQSTVHTSGSELLGVLYDSYFLTLRAPVSHRDVVAQLLRRLVAIAHDVGANDLYRDSDEPADRPAEFQAPQVVSCEVLFLEMLAEVATCAAEDAFASGEEHGLARVEAAIG